jgi:hypothetical protein
MFLKHRDTEAQSVWRDSREVGDIAERVGLGEGAVY